MRKKYNAFISYSSKDADIGHRLYRDLEKLKIPASVDPPGWLARNRRFSLFLDRKNLKVSADHWSRGIYEALDETLYLVVLCSRRSAEANEVDKEVRYFLEKNGGDLSRVIPVIVEGEPWASEEEADRVLPPSLRGHWKEFRPRNLPNWKEVRGQDDAGGNEKRLARWLSVQVASSMLEEAPDKLWAMVEKERRSRLVLLTLAFLLMSLAVAGTARWAVLEHRQAGIREAQGLLIKAHEELAAKNASEALAYLSASLKVAPTMEALNQLDSLILRRSWLVPMAEPPEGTMLRDPGSFRGPKNFYVDTQTGALVKMCETEDCEPHELRKPRANHFISTLGYLDKGKLFLSVEFPVEPESGKPGRDEDAGYSLLFFDVNDDALVEWQGAGWLKAVAFNPATADFYVAYSPHWGGAVRVEARNFGNDKHTWMRRLPFTGNKLYLAPDGATLLTPVASDGDVRLAMLNTINGEEINPGLIVPSVKHLAFSHGGRVVAVVDSLDVLRMVTIDENMSDSVLPMRLSRPPVSLDFTYDGHYLRVEGNEPEYFFIHANPLIPQRVSVHRLERTVKVFVTPSGGNLIIISQDTNNSYVELRTPSGGRIGERLVLSGIITEAELSPDGRLLALISRQNPEEARLVSLEFSGEEGMEQSLKELPPLPLPIAATSVLFHPGGDLLLAADYGAGGGRMCLMALSGAKEPAIVTECPAHTDEAVFSPDGTILITFGEGLSFWRAGGLEPMEHNWNGVEGKILQVLFHPRRNEFLVRTDKSISYHNSREQVWSFPGQFTDAVFSPSGKFLAVQSGDRVIHISDVKTGRDVMRRLTVPQKIQALHLTGEKDGRLALMVATINNTFNVYEMQTQNNNRLFIYNLEGSKAVLWQSTVLFADVLGFLNSSPLTVWDREGYSALPGLNVSSVTDAKAWMLAEALGGWRLDENEVPRPSGRSLLERPEDLAETDHYQNYIRWLQSRTAQRPASPGSETLLTEILDNLTDEDDYYALRQVLTVDPTNEKALRQYWNYAGLHVAERLFMNSPDVLDLPFAEAQDNWNMTARLRTTEAITGQPAAMAMSDFWNIRAMRLCPQSPDILSSRFVYLFLAGEYEEAEKILKQALADFPESDKLHTNMADMTRSLGRLDESFKHIMKTREIVLAQEPLDVKELLFADINLYTSSLVSYEPGRHEKVTAQIISDLSHFFDLKVQSVQSAEFLSYLNYYMDVTYLWWPAATETSVEILEHILAIIGEGQTSDFVGNEIMRLKVSCAWQHIFMNQPEKAAGVLKGLSINSASVPLAVAEVMMGESSDEQALMDAVTSVLIVANDSYNEKMAAGKFCRDTLSFFYALEYRGLEHPFFKKARKVLEDHLAEEMRRGFFAVKHVSTAGAAERAGLMLGDIIVGYNGLPIINMASLEGEQMLLKGNEEKPVSIIRDGKPMTIKLGSGWLGAYFTGVVSIQEQDTDESMR
ncbi:hypothetical protein C4J81_17355 [Deltaproteobacteria bacterium Smac51]|nr:hypothetical protein C4J81_17355 [Deltaproteobacteria bacterium Smac51]